MAEGSTLYANCSLRHDESLGKTASELPAPRRIECVFDELCNKFTEAFRAIRRGVIDI
jgi:hypothetical protein